MNKFLFPHPVMQQQIIGLLRIIIGVFLIIHGKEVFDAVKMKEYAGWDVFKSPVLPYVGKGAEFIAGVLLLPGFLTRLGSIINIGAFGYITFFIGHGKFWMEDQHPFLFVLFGILFLFAGPGAWSLDAYFFKNKKMN